MLPPGTSWVLLCGDYGVLPLALITGRQSIQFMAHTEQDDRPSGCTLTEVVQLPIRAVFYLLVPFSPQHPLLKRHRQHQEITLFVADYA